MQCRMVRIMHVLRVQPMVQRSFISYSSDKMFNRMREFTCLMDTLRSTPQLNIITGPVNSSKTLLVEKVLADLVLGEITEKKPQTDNGYAASRIS